MWIYRIRNKTNGKVLIGQTTQNPPRNRWTAHRSLLCRNAHYNSHLQSAWNSYGADSFEFELIEQCASLEDLNLSEQDYILLSRSTNPSFGYNIQSGGESVSYSLEFKERARQRMLTRYASGWVHPMTGRHHNVISRDLMRSSHKKIFTKMSTIRRGRIMSFADKEKRSLAWTKQYPSVISPSGEIHSFSNLRRFCKMHELEPKAMRELMKLGKYKQHKGWTLFNRDTK